MTEEHIIVLGFLAKLEILVGRWKNASGVTAQELAQLQLLAEKLLDTESHHRREEDVLFPALEAIGIDGPPAIMRAEHDDMRESKRQLLELTAKAGRQQWENWRREVMLVASNLIGTLRDHIDKEDKILYPAAMSAITDDESWRDMKAACDRIGYCKFTPKC